MPQDKQDSPATDAEIQEIIRRNEAGVADLLEFYDEIERTYFAAVSAPEQVIVSGINTTVD